jgi:hypothetical protein
MTRTRKRLTAILAVGAIVALFVALRVASYTPAVGPPVEAGELGFPWRGVLHVHSLASDGAGDIDEIVAAAAEAGIDFLVLSDHNPLASDRLETAWHGEVLLIAAEEISTEQGHLLALQVGPHRYRFGPAARQAIDDIHDEGGWALVAHGDHAWQAWRGGWGGTEGLEVINLAAAWSRQTALSGAVTVGTSFIDSDHAALKLLRGPWPMLRLWDSLIEVGSEPAPVPRRRVAIGAADAHGPVVGPVPGYAETLAAVSNLVWLEQSPGQARASGTAASVVEENLMEALRGGRAAVETTALGDARSFRFIAESPQGIARMGEFAAWERGPWRVRVDFETSAEARIILLHDGEQVAQANAPLLEADAEAPGTYRAEVYRTDVADREAGGPPWMVSNPIYLWPAAARTASLIRRVPPLPAPPMSRDLLAEAEFVANDMGVPRNGVERGDEMATWSFALDPDSAVDAFAGMVWRLDEPMDWSGADGVVVDLRAAAPLRINLEVRAYTADGTSESWVFSLKAGPGSEATAVPWIRFRPPWSSDLSDAENAGPRRPTGLDMRRVHGVFLVVTPLLLREGSAAEVQLRALGLYGREREGAR